MPLLADSSLWIDFARPRTPRATKQLVIPYIQSPDAVVAEPIRFEVLRGATDHEYALLEMRLRLMPMLPTPPDVWNAATKLARTCQKRGVNAGSLDLLIAAIAIHYRAELITLDRGFELIAKAIPLRTKLLHRP